MTNDIMKLKYSMLRDAFVQVLKRTNTEYDPLLVDALLNAIRDVEENIDETNTVIEKIYNLAKK